MNKEEDNSNWFDRIKQFLQVEPQDQESLIRLLRDAKLRKLIDGDTLNMIESVIQFTTMQVRDVMLPRRQMTSIATEQPLADIMQLVTETGHSRFPVIDTTQDEFIGILHAKDLLQFINSSTENFDVHDIIRSAFFVPESKRLDLLLSEFRNNRNHMALVVDEYGTVSGFVTIEDIIEQIIGDIEDEFDIDEEAYIKFYSHSECIVKSHMPVDEFNEAMKTNFSDDDYDTIGGIIIAKLGHLPHRGESILIDGLEFKVINADARRIKLLSCIDKRETDIEESSQ